MFIIFALAAIGVGIYKGRKKGTYDKIEHGSSDWSEGGEQYRVLNKHEGIILAENNYLPLDKIGNINVLIPQLQQRYMLKLLIKVNIRVATQH